MNLSMAWSAVVARLRSETGDPDPRWLYLTRKVCDVSALFVLFHYAGHMAPLTAACVALAIYTVTGLAVWYEGHRFTLAGFLRDVIYHAWIPGVVPALVWAWLRPPFVDGVLVLIAWTAGWLALELAGFGVVRNPNDPNA